MINLRMRNGTNIALLAITMPFLKYKKAGFVALNYDHISKTSQSGEYNEKT